MATPLCTDLRLLVGTEFQGCGIGDLAALLALQGLSQY